MGAPPKNVLMLPGDMLYIPRGMVHNAHAHPAPDDLQCVKEDSFSAHITYAVPRALTWTQLLLKALRDSRVVGPLQTPICTVSCILSIMTLLIILTPDLLLGLRLQVTTSSYGLACPVH